MSPIRATCPAQLIILDFITRIIFDEEYRSWSSFLCSHLRSPVTSSLLGPNIFLSTLFTKTVGLHSYLNENNKVLYQHERRVKIIVFMF
jgi:hypothetical protein